ncbi:MAG TPA: metallophosphoesterase family protein, partial [Chthonomonadaceae bacterium]|nr:metallophosphoesterase family protein [Chthonomonadaceae bacterium]
MRAAAIYDIHGNLPALEAVLQDIRRAGVDEIVVGGDVVPGPMPRETLDHLLSLDLPVRFIHGNGEIAILEQMAGREPVSVPEPVRPLVRWTAEQLPVEYQPILAGWPKTLSISISGLG